jgi:hypothetical protein
MVEPRADGVLITAVVAQPPGDGGGVDLGVELDPPDVAAPERLQAGGAVRERDCARRQRELVAVPLEAVEARGQRPEQRIFGALRRQLNGDPADLGPHGRLCRAAGGLGQQLRAEADAEERDLPLDRRADQIGLRAQCRVPRRLLAAEGDDAVDRVEVRERAEVLLDRAERLGRVAEERLLEVMDDGDHSARTRDAMPASVARP